MPLLGGVGGNLIALLLVLFLLSVETTVTGPFKGQLSQPRINLAGAATDSTMMFAGGEIILKLTDTVDQFNLDGNLLGSTSHLSEPRTQLVGASSPGIAIFAGGLDMYGFPATTVDIYRGSTNQWMTTFFGSARTSLTAATIGERMFFAGGQARLVDYADIEIYDTTTLELSSCACSLSEKKHNLASGAVEDKFLLFAGGYSYKKPPYFYPTVDAFDYADKTWKSAELSQGRALLGGVGGRRKIVFIGGYYGNNAPSDVVDIFDTFSQTWFSAKTGVPRYGTIGTSLNGVIMFMGGFDGNHVVSVGELFDEITMQWTSFGASPGTEKYQHAVAAAGALILFAGGVDQSSNPTSEVDEYLVTPSTPPPSASNSSTGTTGMIPTGGGGTISGSATTGSTYFPPSPDTTTIDNGQQIILQEGQYINGSLTFGPDSKVQMNITLGLNKSVEFGGCVNIEGGSLNVGILGTTAGQPISVLDNRTIVLITSHSSCLHGTFHQVNMSLIDGNGQSCKLKDESFSQYSDSGIFAVTFIPNYVSSSCSSNSDSKKMSTVIACVITGALILLTVLAIIIVYHFRQKLTARQSEESKRLDEEQKSPFANLA